MSLSPEDQRLVTNMQEREFNIKKRKRAANAIFYESRRYRRVLVTLGAVIGACVVAAVFIANGIVHHDWEVHWRPKILLLAIGAIVGAILAQGVLSTRLGRWILGRKTVRLNQKYSGDLHAGRRWMQFFYNNEDISYYVPQILYTLENEKRFNSVQSALEYAKKHARENAEAQARALRQFNAVALRTNLVIISSVDTRGRPSVRAMRFVKSDRPGVWYVTSAPNAPKVPEFDGGRVALITVPTEDGEAISSNRVTVRRAEKTLMDIAHLYRDQAPRYLDGMTEEDRRLEIVYELTLQSAKVDSWVSHDVVFLEQLNQEGAMDLSARL